MNQDELKIALHELAQSFVAQGHALVDIWQAILNHASVAVSETDPKEQDASIEPEQGAMAVDEGTNLEAPPQDVKISGEVTAPGTEDQPAT